MLLLAEELFLGEGKQRAVAGSEWSMKPWVPRVGQCWFKDNTQCTHGPHVRWNSVKAGEVLYCAGRCSEQVTPARSARDTWNLQRART